MNNGYYLHQLNTYEGIFDQCIDCVYIITMEKSTDRHNNIEKQLLKSNLHKNTKILFNQGYKQNSKYLNRINSENDFKIENSSHDLFHANLFIHKDAKNNYYENILILEDDFIITNDLSNPEHIKNISEKISSEKKNILILYLGLIPFYSTNIQSSFFHKNILSLGNHAVIYNKNYTNNILNQNHFIIDIDIYNQTLIKINLSRLFYFIPLIMQSFPESENKQNWGFITPNNKLNEIINFFGKIGLKYNIVYPDFEKLGLNTFNPEEGFYTLYKNQKFI